MIAPAEPAGRVAVIAPPFVSTKKPCVLTAVNVEVLIDPVCQLTDPSLPNPVCVPLFVIVTPLGIVNVSPLSPKVTVPQFVLGVNLFTFT